MTRDEAMKTAATTLRALSKEIGLLKESNLKRDYAEKIAACLVKSHRVEADEVLTKVAELSKQSIDELVTLEKALELTEDDNKLTLKLGALSEKSTSEGVDPITAMILEDI